MDLTRWNAPEPRELPEWRARMIENTASMQAKMAMREAIHAGRVNLLPEVSGMSGAGVSVGSVAAEILSRTEVRRLSRAALYYASASMTSLALAAAQTPPAEPVSLSRLPAPDGLIVFAEPIGGYTEDAAAALAGTPAHLPGASALVTTPIVAASWSVWSPEEVQLDRGSVRWHWNSPDGMVRIPPEWSGVWVTWYSPRGLFSGLAPDTVIGRTADGGLMTAGDIDGHRNDSGPVLSWDNEILMAEGATFEPPAPDTTAQWSHVLYTTWQLMSQDGRTRWTETEEIPRERAGRKRDARAGIAGPGEVRVVRVHSTHRPPARATEQDAEQSTGRHAPQWSCRWPVRPHRRSHCMDPGAHQDGGCSHEDRIISGHTKGPAGAPFRPGSTVHLWDRMSVSGDE